jgi:hypothetical protein
MSSSTPRHSDLLLRRQYKMRLWRGLAIGSVLFVAASPIGQPLFMLFNGESLSNALWFAVGLGLIFIILGMVIALRMAFAPVRWPCSVCSRTLTTEEPWICGYCRRPNNNPAGFSFLDQCEHCGRQPGAYTCLYCGHCAILISGSDERDAASAVRSLVPHEADEQVRSRRARELEDRIHDKQKLELEIELAKLRLKLNPPKPIEVDPRQQWIDQFWQRIEDAKAACKTIQQTVVEEKKAYAEIEADIDLEASHKEQMKDILSRMFESIRIDLGGDVHV